MTGVPEVQEQGGGQKHHEQPAVEQPKDAAIAPILTCWDDRAKAESNFNDSCRVFHGRGGCYAGLEWCVVDAHWPVTLITLYREPPAGFIDQLIQQLLPRLQAAAFEALVIQHRHLAGTPNQVVWGKAPDIWLARRGELRFQLSLTQQNVGYFLDMEPGRQWLEQGGEGKRVLNLFAYSCAFSVVAKAAGAASVVNVDMSSRALSQGRQNHRLNHLSTDGVEFLPLDILKSWSRIRRRGPFDRILIDPPSFQKGSFIATRDYQKVVRRIPELAAPGAEILACLNAPELDSAFLQEVFTRESPECVFTGRLTPHQDFPDRDPERQLKLLSYRYEPSL